MTQETHSCKTCVHEKKSVGEYPCNSCYSRNAVYSDLLAKTTGVCWEPVSSLNSLPPTKEVKVGVKLDSGKPPLSRIPKALLDEVAKVLEFGANKYAWDNWRNGLSYHRVASAAMRHLTAFINCETMDSESSLSHLSHAACCIAFLLEYEKYPEKFKEFDDRFFYTKDSEIK